jgi:hypothetical protein
MSCGVRPSSAKRSLISLASTGISLRMGVRYSCQTLNEWYMSCQCEISHRC